MSIFAIIYLVTGVTAGCLTGLLGVGGGIIIVPILYTLFAHLYTPDLAMHLAIGTSLSFMMINTPYGVYQHHLQKHVNWSDFSKFWLVTLVGAAIGVYIADGLKGDTLKHFFGLFCMGSAFYIMNQLFFMPDNKINQPHEAKPYKDKTIGFLVGLLSAILGIGGSTIMVPYLLWRGRSMREAVGTSASLIPLISTLGTLGYMLAGLDRHDLPAESIGYVYPAALFGLLIGGFIGSYFGARMAKYFPEKILKALFIILLCLTAYKMFH